MKIREKNTFSQKDILIALEISDCWIKLAVSKKVKGKRGIVKFCARKIEGYKESDILKTLKDLFNRIKISKAKIFLSIPRSRVAVKFLTPPSTNPAEIKKMIRFKASEELPYSPDEIIVDDNIIEIGEEGYSKAMMVVVHKDVIYKNIGLLKKINIKPEVIALSSEGVLSLLVDDKILKEAFSEPVCIINMDYSATDIEVISNNNLIFSRNISMGFRDIDNTGWGGGFVKEVNRSLNSFQRESGKNISKILILGDQIKTGPLKDNLEKEVAFPIKFFQPLKSIPMFNEALASFETESYNMLSFLSVCGIALYGDRLNIKLLPEELRIEKRKSIFRKEFILTRILAGFLIIASMSILLEKLYYKKVYLEELNKGLRSFGPSAAELEDMSMRLKVINKRLLKETPFLELIREVYKIIPEDVSLTKFTYEKTRLVTLGGLSKDMSAVFEFVGILEKSAFFEDVNIKYTSKKRLRGKELTDFEIHCPISKGRIK